MVFYVRIFCHKKIRSWSTESFLGIDNRFCTSRPPTGMKDSWHNFEFLTLSTMCRKVGLPGGGLIGVCGWDCLTEYFALKWTGTRDITLRMRTFLFRFQGTPKTWVYAIELTFPVHVGLYRAPYLKTKIFGHDRIFGQGCRIFGKIFGPNIRSNLVLCDRTCPVRLPRQRKTKARKETKTYPNAPSPR